MFSLQSNKETMDISDERRKKLEAGKEKLAAFRKKKAKSKKTTKDSGENFNLKDAEPLHGDINNSSDVFAEGHVQPSENEQESKASVTNETLLYQEVADVENVIARNAIISESIVREAEHFVNDENTNSNCCLETDDFKAADPCSETETSDFQQALAQRDKLIGQLTHSLKSKADQQAEKEELVSQVLTLSQQVMQLQGQLKEADNTLQEQLQFHGISGSALQCAKTQMLQLQSIVHEKDKELVLASQQLEKNHESLHRSKEENARLSQNLNEKEEELSHLQQCYDAAVSSHEEKQEKEESEKSHQLVELQHQWKDREANLKSSLENQAKEIEGWRKCEQEWKERESELQQNYEKLFSHSQQVETGKEERLKALEHELEQLRQQNEKVEKEADGLKKENEHKNSSLCKLESLADEYRQLSSLHSNMADEFEGLKSKNTDLEESLRQLNVENEAMRSELEKLESELADEQAKLMLSHKHQAELESKHSIECDKLNNKINELQSSLSHAQECLTAVEKAFEGEKEAVEVLQQELLAKQSSHDNRSRELVSIMTKNSELQTAIQFKDEQIKELENMLEERAISEETLQSKSVDPQEKIKLEECVDSLTKQLKELKDDCEKYVQQISQMQTERLSSAEKVDTLNELLDKRNETLDQESEKCKRLESQLQMVEEERGTLNENIKALNCEIECLKDDLNNERLQKDIIGEELISLESKLVDSQNLMRNNSDEHGRLMDKYESDIDKLKKEVDRNISLEKDSNKLDADLKDSEQSLQIKTKDCEKLIVEVENLKEGERKSFSKIQDLDNELAILKQKDQEMTEQKNESLQNQEEMQRQLEATISQWQKLQLIVQEKEIELQNLHDDLDEQKRICNTMRRNHEEYLDLVQSDVDALNSEKEDKAARIAELEGIIAGLHETLAAKDIELSDTVTKVEAVDVSSQNLATHLLEKEKELDVIISDKEKVSAELSDKERDIANITERITTADSQIAHLSKVLEEVRAELDCANSKADANASLMKCLQNENKELSDKEKHSTSQIESLEVQLADVQKYSSEIDAENSNLKSMIASLESLCAEKDELMSQEVINRKELELLLDQEKQNCSRLHGSLSSMFQDIESKDELLMMNSVVLQEKVSELSQKEKDLMKGCEELQYLREDLDKAKEAIKTSEAQLALNSNDKESVIKKLQQKDTDLDHLFKEREVSNCTIENLRGELKEMETNAENQAEETSRMNSQLSHLQNDLSEKSTFLSKEQKKVQGLIQELNAELQQSLRLKGALSSLSNDVQDRENSLMQQSVLLEEKTAALSCIEIELSEKDKNARDMEEQNKELEDRIRELASKELSQETEITDLKDRLDKHVDELTEISAVNLKLSEHQTQFEQEVKKQERDMVNMQQDNEILQKECCDLRTDLQEKENKNLSLMQEVDLMKSAMETSSEEKEMLKNNFDACLEEMHQKSSAQEIEIGHLKSKIVEELRSRDQGQEEMKEMYIQQLAQMEDRLMEVETAKSQVEKEMIEKDSKLDRVKDDYEQQVSEIELSLHAAQSEVTKIKDTISKINTDHENELTDVKSLHELQMSELMENYLTLEKSMTEVQKNLSDQAENMKQERIEMEQSFESLMSEMDERKRRSDSDITKLKYQQDEMTKDHEREMKALEKKYETQLFDLEDRCSVVSSELERVRKSVVGVEGDFVEERLCLENKIDDLETTRRDLEIKCSIQEDDIVLIKEHSNMREEEVKSILKTAAEKQRGMKCEMEVLEEELRVLKMDNELSCKSLKKEFESRIEDISAENEHLKNRLESFEMNAELDKELKGHEDEKEGDKNIITKLEDMKKQMTALADENLSLKRRLLGHKSLEKKVRLLSSGVEDVRLPLEEPNEEEIILPSHMAIVTSTPSKKNYEDDMPFSPTAEEVSLIEGFVSETNVKPISSQRFEKITPQQSADEEPDFVAEEDDRFEPEMVIEKAVDDFGDGQYKRNIHPIQDNEVIEGFQPEISDQFFVEISEQSNTEWPLELSVGSSPTSKIAPQSFGFFDEKDSVETDARSLDNELNSMPYSITKTCPEDNDLLDKHIKQMKEDLEEDYEFKLRKQKQDVILEYESKYENTEKELEQHFAQKEQSIRHDWEIKFAKAVKKMKKDFEKKLQKQSANQKGKKPCVLDEENVTPNQEVKDEEEESEGLGDVVQQLSKENQELAEVRDELLKQIEISQARGRHSRVQHELQSMLSEREKDMSCQDMSSSSNDGVVEPEVVRVETVPTFASRPHAPISVDVQTNSSQNMEPPERSPTVEAERILEELEDIEQQSSQDLPLEWELTNTIPVESDVSVENAARQHQSVWEVFGNRCKRQDCLELDVLRSQYESQLLALQEQLEDARRENQHSMDASQKSYEEFMSKFREKLDGDQKDLLDELVTKLEDKYQHNVSLEVMAVKTALEQVYISKSHLEVSAVEAKHEEIMKEMKARMEKDYKERLNKMTADQNRGTVDSTLTDKYNKLIQKINQDLDDKVIAQIEASSSGNKTSNVDSQNERDGPLSHEIRDLLMNQQEEISSLRSQILGDYELVLQSRAKNVIEQTQEVADLEEQLKSLQIQCSEQVASFQEMLAARDDEQKKLSQEERNNYEVQQTELKHHYEKRVQDMEASFEREINCIKEKYEDQISGLVHARLGLHNGSLDAENIEDNSQPPMVDTDSDNADTPRSSATDTAIRMKELEEDLRERDSQIHVLKSCLDCNDDDFKKRVEELERELQEAKSACNHLEELVEENKQVIETLEHEKKESEKLYKDLLEKESPRSKGSATRGYISCESVDDSFSSAREEIQDTPRSFDSNENAPEAVATSEKSMTSDSTQEDKDDDHNNTIPFANESVESDFMPENSNDNNNNNNNNNNDSSSCLQSSNSLEEQISSLKDQVETLSQQLEEMKASENKLKCRIEENQHGHLEMMENLRQELEHEKQVEVETLQSEFKVQMEVELKRQAAELTQSQDSSPASSSSSSCPTEQQIHQPDIHIGDKIYSTFETADDDILEASSNNNMFLQTTNFELKTVVMATPKDDVVIDGNLSDDSKVTSNLSPTCSPTHSSAPVVAPLMQSLPLTDMEKEMQAMRDEYETKINLLTSEIEQVNEDNKSLTASHQQKMEELKLQLNEAEARYDRLMEGVHSGDHPELNDLMKDKYDQELDLVKSLMQKDYDEMLKEEKKKFMEHHRKLMGNFMEDKTQEDEKTEKKHKEEVKELKERLESDFETRIHDYEQEIERLNRDLDLLKGATPRGSDEGTLDGTLPEIEEITLPTQHQELNSASPGSEISTRSSPSLKSPGLSYEESEEETEAEKISTLQVRDFSDAVKAPSPSPCLLKEKEQLELKVQQLVAQVERLTQQLVERQDSSPVSPLHSPHNTTLKAEDPALISMLQSDLDRMDAERESVQTTNDRLLSLLSDTVKTYVTVEDNINRKLKQVVSGGTPRSQSQQSPGGDSGDGSSSRAASVELGTRHGPSGDSQSSRQGSPADFLKGASPDVDTSQDSHALDNTSILSNATDEGLEISLRLAESIFVGPDLDVEGEEILSDARGRLTSAVERLLELMEQSMSQLHEAKSTQEDLLSTLATRARDVEASQSRGSELNSQLAAEIEAKEYLGLELHKAEGLIAGFVADREANSKQVQTLEEQREALIVELDLTRSRLEEFQRSQSEIDAVREELTHQQTLLRENVGQETQALLNEVSNLNQERRELATQLQHQLDLSRKRLSEMEALAEEAERNHETVVEEKNQALEDLGLQLDNTERQLKSSKAFVDELLVEREMEREEHQKEIDKMKATIEGKDRSANSQERMQREIADLTEQLQSRISTQSALHQRIVDLQKVLEDKELGTNDLKVWVSQLEGELDQKFTEEDHLKNRISKLERQLTEQSENNEDELEDTVKAFTPRSEAESMDSTSIPSPVNTGHRNSVVSLEEELMRSKETKDELDQENNTLKEQLHDQMLQISGLKNQIDQMRHYTTADDSDATQLRERLAQERDQVEKKEAEIADAERKIEHMQSLLQTKQMEAEEMSSRVSKILEMGETQEENERLRTDLQELRSQVSEMSSSSQPSSHQLSMPASLLEEKNEEISELRTRLQIVEAEVGQKSDQVTIHEEKILHLQQRLKDRDEEIVDLQDSLASARRGEACLDMSLPMSDEVNSMLNISMTGRTSIQQEFEDTIAQREGEVHSLELQIATLRKDLEKNNAKLSEKNEEEEKWKTELSEKDEEIQKLQQDLLSVAKESDEMRSSLENLQTEKENQTDHQKMVESLEDCVQEKDNEIYQMTLEIQELKTQLEEAGQATEAMEKVIEQKDADLTKVQEDRDEKRDQLQEKEHTLDQMIIQIDGLQTEISGLTTFQTDLQKDYDTIQSMLDEKEKVLEALTQELTDTKSQQDALESMEKEKNIDKLTNEIESLKSQIEEQDRVILSLKDELEISSSSHEEQILSRDNQIAELRIAARGLKPSISLEKVQQSSESSALSPKTKEQISQLKTELRKAHRALEEMQRDGGPRSRETNEDSDFVDGGRFSHQAELEALRKIAQEQEEELVVLKSQAKNPVMEEMIQAKKVTSVESQGNRSSRGSGIDDFSFASNQSNTDGVPPRIQELLDRLHNLGEDLLSASDFEYLQRHLFQRPADDGSSSDTSAWSRERAALMETIVAVKDLLQQADRLAAKSVEELAESGDWRSELLDALIQVYQSEKQVLKAEVGSANNAYPEMDIVMQLESRIHDLEQVHQNGLDEMLKADRQSLLDEVDNLHHRLLEAKAQLEDTRHTLDQRIAELEKAKSDAEWKLERQIQMLEYKIQQEGVIQEDLKKSLNLERQRVSELNSQSSQERNKTYELQSELSSTQIQLSKVRDALEREQHRFNSVTDALEEEQAKTVHLTELLDSTKKKMKSLREDVAQQQAAADSEAILEELQLELEKERQKSYEYSEAEEHAQKQLVQLSEKLDTVKKKLAATKEDYETKIEQMHREWMDREIQDRKDREMETVQKLTDLLDVERESHRKAMENERHTARQLKDALEEFKSENDRFLHLYEVEKNRADRLEKDAGDSNGMLKHLRTTEKEAGELQEKVLELEQELSHVHERASALEAELNRGHHNGHVTSQTPTGEYHREAIGHLMTASYIDEELKVRLAQCCSRLQIIASKLQDMTGHANTQGQGHTNGDDIDGGFDESKGLQIVMEELEKLKSNIREREEKRQNTLEKDKTVQADQLLQHNKQLAEHVKKLKLDKEQLSGAIKRMEDDKKSKISLPQYISDVTSDEEGVYDRTVWASEKLSLQMAIDSAEHEIQHLRSELRKFSSVTKADGQLLKLDPDKTQRLYGKYLRAESFRKALIYQKKYLLLLLGGYRDTEQETLAILASMGGFPSPRTRTNNGPAMASPLGTFRSAGRAVIAIFRMKYLVRKWKRATRVGSPVMTGQITSQHAYVPNPSSSYTLPNNRQQQDHPHQQQQQQYHHHLHHLNNQRHLHNSSPRSSSPSAVIVSIGNSSHLPHHRVSNTNGSSSDYVESLTNGGLSSLVYSNNSGNPTQSSTATSSHHSSHQVPSSSHPYQHQHRPQQRPLHQNHNNNATHNTTPPTKESSKPQYNYKAARGNKDSARRQILQEATSDSDSPASRGNIRSHASSNANSDDENFMRYLENVQQQLSEGSSPSRRVSWR